MFREVPPEPHVPDAQRGEGTLQLRYEDVVQDGRMRLEPMSHAIGAALWRRALATHPFVQQLRDQGIFPILSRLQIESGEGPVSVRTSVTCRGSFELLRTLDEKGRLRWRVDMWAEIVGERGRTHGPPPERAGEPIVLGRVSAQHVLTRPFGPVEERHVVEIPGGVPENVSLRDVPWSPPHQAIELPKGAIPIDDAFALDACPIVFGIGHTDSNQHVNSLVYPRIIEEAALRRFHALELPTRVYARYVDIAFRKPCFAGDRMRVMLRTYRWGSDLGVVAALITAGEAVAVGPNPPNERAHCFARMQFTS
jgi:hypothetical protein